MADLIGVECVRFWWEDRTLARKRRSLHGKAHDQDIGYGHEPKAPEGALESLEIMPRP